MEKIIEVVLIALSILTIGCQPNRLICEEKTDWRKYHYSLKKCDYEHTIFNDSTNTDCKKYAMDESTVYEWYRCTYFFGKEMYRIKVKE